MGSKFDTKKDLVNGAIWNTFGSMFYLGIFFLTNILVGRWGKNFVSSSLYTNPMRFVNPFAAFALYGMRSFQVSDSNSKYKDKEYILSRYVTTGLAFFGCIIMAVIEGYSGVELAIIFVFLLYKLTEAFQDVYHGKLQKENRLDVAGKSNTLKGVLILIGFTSVFVLTHNLVYTTLSILISTLICLFTVDIRIVKKKINVNEKADKKRLKIF